MKINVLVLSLLLTGSAFARNAVGCDSIRTVVAKPDYDRATVAVEVELADPERAVPFVAAVSFEGQVVASGKSDDGGPVEIEMPDDFLRWTPDHPFLYDLKISILRNGTATSEAQTEFAMRSFGTWRDGDGTPRFTLNSLPIFLFGILWTGSADGASSDEDISADLQKIKDLGYNMVRVRDEVDVAQWLPLCDRIGLVLWHDGLPEVARHLQAVPSVEVNLPLNGLSEKEATDAYVDCANRLYNETYRGLSAAVFARFADTEANPNGLMANDRSTMKLDVKRLFSINRKISHALAE